MGNLIIGKLLRLIGRKLDGYKTTVGGIGMILSGLAGLLGYMFPETANLPQMEINDILSLITGGLAVIGIGGKIEKTKNVLATKRGNPGEAPQDRH